MFRKVVGSFFCSFLPLLIQAQVKDIDKQEQLWLGYFNQTRLTKHSGIWLDLHFRSTENFVQRKALGIYRFGYVYHLANAKITTGYAHLTRYETDQSANLVEHRGWQQVEWGDVRATFTVTHRLRLEQRFLQQVEDNKSRFRFNNRARYSLGVAIPIKANVAPRPLAVVLSNEVFVNFGSQVVINYFDQNRIFVGLSSSVNEKITAQLGYMHIFQQLPVVNKFASINTVRLFVLHNLSAYSKQ
jgi:hypothetical protein